MTWIKSIRYVYNKYINEANLIKTLYINFKLFPFRTAIKFPILIGRHVELLGLKRGCIQILPDTCVKRNMIVIGVSKWPISSTRGLWTLLRFEPNGVWIVGSDIVINCGCTLAVYRDAICKFGNDILINQRTKIFCKNRLTIGSNSRIGWECQLYDTGFHFIYNKNKNRINTALGNIVIGKHCWITNRCTISGIVYFPDYSILASGSLLNKDYRDITSEGNLFVGNPAILKATGVYRIFNEKYQKELMTFFRKEKKAFIEPDDSFNIKDLMTSY